MKPVVLLISVQRNTRLALRKNLPASGWRALAASCSATALSCHRVRLAGSYTDLRASRDVWANTKGEPANLARDAARIGAVVFDYQNIERQLFDALSVLRVPAEAYWRRDGQ